MGIDSNYLQTKSMMTSSAAINQQETANNLADLKDETKILRNTPRTRIMRAYHRTTDALSEYAVKGLKGDKKSTFYEFLTMGIIPYLAGSATMIAIFNAANKFFPNFNKKGAKSFGNKMALGVIFYGIMKGLSTRLVTKPVKWATGIDTEMPYENINYTIPTSKDAPPTPIYEQHKVFETRDFPRFDILYGVDPEDPTNKKHRDIPRNYYFDRIAEKNGLGKNLEASDAEVKPMLKDVISRANTAKSLSSYAWGAVGVMLATQPSWDNFFKALSKQSWTKVAKNTADTVPMKAFKGVKNIGSNVLRISKSFGRNFVKAAKELYKGPASEIGFNKHAGKIFIGLAAALSIFGAINTIHGAKNSENKKIVIDTNKKVTID